MSTKSSSAYINFNRRITLHFFKEMMDDKYYLQNEKGQRIEIPVELVDEFTKFLKKLEVDFNDEEEK